MAISAYTGLPGSGKSYTVVKSVVLPALKKGLTVWCNIPLHSDELEKDGYDIDLLTHFEIEDLQNANNWFDDVLPKGVLLIIDEVQLLWPSGLKQTTANPKHIEFLTKHRHLVGEDGKSTEVILLTQRLSLVANFVRGVIEKTLVTNNLGIVGTPKKYRIDVYPEAVQDRPNKKNKVRDIFGSYDKDVYKYYKSHTQSDTGAGDEARVDNRINAFGGWQFKLSIAFFIALLLFLFFMGSSFLDGAESFGQKPESKTASSAPGVQPSPVLIAPIIKPKKIEREKFFLEQISDIYISLNQGVFPQVKYNFKVSFKSSSTDLDQNTLTLMGYQIVKYNDCLVNIIKDDFTRFVGCREGSPVDIQKDQGFLNGAIAQTVTNQ